MEENVWFTHRLRRSELLVMLVCDIDLRNEQDEDGVLYDLLSSAWPTRTSQDH